MEFIFVATLGKETEGKLPPLEFRSIKAISYPGGARFAVRLGRPRRGDGHGEAGMGLQGRVWCCGDHE